MAIGTRALMLVCGTIPMFFACCIMPYMAMLIGSIQMPNIMLSDLYAAHQNYAAAFMFAYSMCMLMSACVCLEYANFVRDKVPAMAAPAGLFVLVAVFGVGPNLFLQMGFSFEEDRHNDDNNFFVEAFTKHSWAKFLPWFIHVVAASLIFVSIGIASATYLWWIYPLAKKGLLEPMTDVRWKQFWAKFTVWCVILGATVRALQILHDRYIWAHPLLFFEIGILMGGNNFMLFGHFQTMCLLDKTKPLLGVDGIWHFIKNLEKMLEEMSGDENPMGIENNNLDKNSITTENPESSGTEQIIENTTIVKNRIVINPANPSAPQVDTNVLVQTSSSPVVKPSTPGAILDNAGNKKAN